MYRVSCSIEYLEGTLKGLTIPDGHKITAPDYDSALRHFNFIDRVIKTGDFVRATVTGHAYKFRGRPRVDKQAEGSA